ncbi:MAG TPA: hypothetical protein VFZ56_00530 [Gemmatimonadaceae bacterium]
MAAGLARTKILAVLLGPGGLGIVGVIDQTVALVTHFGSLSFPFVALTFLSRARTETAERFTRLYLAFLKVLLAASLLATALAIGIALWRTTLIADELAPYRLPLVLGLAGAPALATAAYLRSVLAAVERHSQAAFFALAGGVALIGTTYAGVRLQGITGLYLGNLAVAVLMPLLIVAYLRRAGAIARSGSNGALDVLRGVPGLPGFTSTIHLLSLVSPLAYLAARVAVLRQYGPVEAGLFHAAYALAIALRVVLGQANVLYLTPTLNRATEKSERASTAAVYVRVLVVLLVLAGLPLVLFPGEWLLLLYSERFAGAAEFLAVFVVAEAVLLTAGVYQMLLIAFDDVRAHALIAVAGQLLLAVLALIWVETLGSLGVGFAFLVGHSLILGLLLLRMRQKHHLPAVVQPLYLLVAGLGTLMGAGWWAVARAPHAALKLGLYLVLASVALRLLTREERAWLVRPWSRR